MCVGGGGVEAILVCLVVLSYLSRGMKGFLAVKTQAAMHNDCLGAGEGMIRRSQRIFNTDLPLILVKKGYH